MGNSIIFDTQTDVLVEVLKFLRQMKSRPEEDSHANLRIQAKYS